MGHIVQPLRHSLFRRIWLASVLSNVGILIEGVGAAWAMTQMTKDTTTVALVQTSAMLPMMLGSIPAGAVADMFDRRKVAIFGLSLSLVSAALLALLAFSHLLTPTILLIFCVAIGSGTAIYGPAWQSSVAEQVPGEVLPQAIALNSISYNLARSFGPAIGGFIVAVAGSSSAFFVNALCYVPLIIVMLLWKRIQPPSRLPSERVGQAIVSGIRYVSHSPPIRMVLTRILLLGIIGASISALMPLITRQLLMGGALTYGVLLGSFGIGGVLGALAVAEVRQRIPAEIAMRYCTIVLGLAMMVVAISRYAPLTSVAMIVTGATWMLTFSMANISIQLSSPRWVAGRVMATFQASITGGVAVGSWMWGQFGQHYGIVYALLASGLLMLISPLLGRWFPLPQVPTPTEEASDMLSDPEVTLAITPRSGPIVIEIDYTVSTGHARDFYRMMQEIQQIRQRNGAYDWSIARDLADETLWVERFHCPTWLDYLRQRTRPTQMELKLQKFAAEFEGREAQTRVRRLLERPFGSVRWKENSPDIGVTDILRLS